MNKNDYTNYYKNHGGYQNSEKASDRALEIRIRSLRANFQKLINPLNRNIRILEIGCGQWTFAEYLRREWFTDYTWFDFDSVAIDSNKNTFPGYQFSDGDVLEFLQNHGDTFDLIFMSHVYEHLTPEDGREMAEKIYHALKTQGIWLNIMPNAGSLFSSAFGRYADLTHKTLYSSGSMSQQLLNAGFQKENISHYNSTFPYIFFEYYQRVVRFLARLLLRSLGYLNDAITTFEIVTIARK